MKLSYGIILVVMISDAERRILSAATDSHVEVNGVGRSLDEHVLRRAAHDDNLVLLDVDVDLGAGPLLQHQNVLLC
jgi:hypothetical protein